MNIVVAKSAGFCFGVKRAVVEAYKVLDENAGKKIYSIGPLIHNEIVTGDLHKRGLIELNDISDINNLKNEIVIIRTHGTLKSIIDILKKNNNIIIDLTCPFVSKIHKLVSEYSENGYKIIVIGDKEHPEVKGIVSRAKNDICVVINEDDIKTLKFDKKEPILIVFQTTTNVNNAKKLVDILRDLFYNSKVVDTICNATQNRQDEVKELAKCSDVMLIIGSISSSNTKKLYEISKENCEDTYLLSNLSDTKKISINENAKVGVSAGASTPENLIEEIIDNVRNEF
ncbi:MAG: 4-hydroxy-3-methylbut-2-enyl diphosphate reductase [Lachnospiraceae bacterium]|nr:4-hydroxy-3-methylbut-2-enyl diphosphate reductase [Lachnospiraceae bacterium]